jgi:predicted membrane-bound spermidine synthase
MLRWAVLALTAVTGFTGLAYEVTWQRYLGILLGAHSEATAAVLGLFLGGLSLGYFALGALARALVARSRGRPAPLLAVYGAIEGTIGAWCLLFPHWFPLVRGISVWLPTGDGALAFAVDVALAALLIVPPATLMGATIPFLTQALARDLADATRVHALVYASNTAGAFAGALASGFVLIGWLGLEGVLRAMGVVNLVVGALLALLGARRRELAALEVVAAPRLLPGTAMAYGAIALLVGFAAMVLQTISIRVAGLSFGSSEYTFSMIVSVFVSCIALGSFAVAALPRIRRGLLVAVLWLSFAAFAALYFALETGPYWVHVLRSLFRDQDAIFPAYYTAAFALLLLVIGPAVVLSGAVLPLLFHALRREVGELGAQAGRLYSLNTLGSLAGALLGGYALFYWLDLHQVYRVAVGALAIAAAIATLRELPRIGLLGAGAALLAALLLIGSFRPWQVAYLISGAFRDRVPEAWTYQGPSGMPEHLWEEPLFYDDDPNSSVAVVPYEFRGQDTRSIIVNGKSDGNTLADFSTMALTALVPALFAERLEHAFVIGLGTGVSVGELAQLEETQSVTVAEISRGVIEAAPFFDETNGGVSKHPKVRIVRSDAYRALLEEQRRFDVIISEPSNPWVTGVEMLFSREFLAEARDRLTAKGVYCQWYHLYETSPEAVDLVLRTYASVFEHVAVWSVNPFDILLLGFRDAESALDLARVEQRFARADLRAAFEPLEISELAELLVHETLPLGVVGAAGLEGPLHSLYHPRLAFEAGRAFLVGRSGVLPFTGYGEAARVGAANSLLPRYLERFDGKVPESLRAQFTREACRRELAGCGALATAWYRAERGSPALQRFLANLPGGKGPVLVRELAWFYQPSDPERAPRIRPQLALSSTERFLAHYAHSAPFDPARLRDFWRRCGRTPPGVEACAPGLKNADALVAGEAPPEIALWLAAPREDVQSAARRAVGEPEQDPFAGEDAAAESDDAGDAGGAGPAESVGPH